ncbi:MAG: hypothetical protein AAGI52_13800 [Bacteroidota bacterium]
MPTCPRCAFLALVLAVLAFTGCDTNNPGSGLDEVAGTYTAATLRFDPEATNVLDADVLETLRNSLLTVEVFADGQMTVSFEPLGGARQLVTGTARASSRTVTISARTDADRDRMALLLLPPEVSLARDDLAPDRLTASLLLTGVDLEAFDPVLYAGLTSVRGRLEIQIDRTAD